MAHRPSPRRASGRARRGYRTVRAAEPNSLPSRTLLRDRGALAARVGAAGPAAVDPLHGIGLEARRHRLDLLAERLELRDHTLKIGAPLDIDGVDARSEQHQKRDRLLSAK